MTSPAASYTTANMEHEVVVTEKKGKRAAAEPTLIGLLESGEEIFQELIRKHHHHLASLKILLLCTNKEIKTGGRQRPGKVQKSTPMLRYLTSNRGDDGADAIITVSLPMWNDADTKARHAILDQLLTCLEVNEDPETGDLKLAVTSPPLSVFAEIVERYGAFTDELRDLQTVLARTPETVQPTRS